VSRGVLVRACALNKTMGDTDKRYVFLGDYVLKTMKFKPDKWQKCIGVEENKIFIQEFFDKADNVFLIISANAAGILTPTDNFIPAGKTKAVYFIKRAKETIGTESIQNQLLFGDLSYAPLDQMSSLVDDVLVPLLGNGRNQDTWPHVVSGDVLHHVHKLKSNVFVVTGQVKGKTLLPLPPGTEKIPEQEEQAEEPKENLIDSQILHTLESVVIEWSHQVRDVLKRDSSEILLQGLNPLPSTETTFWADRYENLQCIFDQLQTHKVKAMAEVLRRVQSSYYPAFQQMFKDVVAGLAEAKDIHVHLKPLKWLLEDMEEKEFNELTSYIKPLFLLICKTWASSKFYSSPTRLIVLLQEICNLMINQCRAYLNPEELFKQEVDQGIESVQVALKILKQFRASYQSHKDNLSSYFEGKDRQVVLWDFDNSLVFARYDCFIERLEDITTLFTDARDMLKLEKIEFGGVKGSALSGQVEAMFEEFNNLFKVFGDLRYDGLDPSDSSFIQDFENFQLKIRDMDRRLGSVVSQAFDDCPLTESAFKLIAMFGSLLERPIIKQDMWPKYPVLLSIFHTELDEAKVIFDRQMEAGKANDGYYPVNKNMSLVSGAMKWAKELKARIQNPYSNFRLISHPCIYGEEGQRMEMKYQQMMQLLKGFEEQVYQEWTKSVDERSQYNLTQPLLTRDPDTKLISVNFNPQLVSVLREVKYLDKGDSDEIPSEAARIFEAKESYRQYVANLDLAQQWYNKTRNTLLDVEFPLVEGQLSSIDDKLMKAEKELCWKSDGVWEYIEQTRDQVHDLELRVQKAKDNVVKINKIMSEWVLPVFERKENKKDALLNLDDREDRLSKRYAIIQECANKVHALLQENQELFKASPDSEVWKAYVNYVDDMVVDGCFNAIECSMKFLLHQTDHRQGLPPLFQAQLELHAPDMVFKPSLDFGMGEGFFEMVEELLTDIYNLSTLVKRLSTDNGMEHYHADMMDMAELSEMKTEILERVQAVMDKACEYRNGFDNYAYLWVDDRNEFMKQFLTYGHVLTTEEIEAHAEDGVPENPPTLDMFKEQVDQYEKIYCEVEEINPIAIFDSWFRVDAKPFKQALLNIIKRWSFMFKQHLIDHVTNSLSDLEKFIKVVDKGMAIEVNEDLDYDCLVALIENLRDVKSRQNTTDEMFEPLKQTIELLKTYDQEMSEDIHKQLEELPEKWNNTKKCAATVKQAVAPLQSNEVAILRRKCSSFDVQQHEFRERFRKDAPFRFAANRPYQTLDHCHMEITGMENEMKRLYESAAIFEINAPDFKQIKQCRREVILLKSLWDMITLVKTSIEDWKKTKWANINVEQMELDCKKFAKDIRALDKEMRAWDSFGGLDSVVKNMLTSLRAVSELQNPAIRDRHWQQLMQATKVKFSMDEDTTLADLLMLNLHNFEDEVRGIVDKSVKEMGMEKILKELDITWGSMEFKYEPHTRTKIPLLQSDEELIETLEENQVQLQNLMTSKYIGYFLDQVSTWQKSLSTADSVITIWFEVQRTWSYLEAIFIGSEDIRSQLPEDSKRFEGIDIDFKELVAQMEATPNVVKATNKPGLYDKLEDLQNRLALCEKALAEYLDTKRLAFPRFYFVSSADLLDILSNGTNPVAVSRHLAKLFDNMAQLKFKPDDSGNPTKTALGMFSKEKEYVEFDTPCECVGPVETWLNTLMEIMRSTVRQQMTEGNVTYEEKPREQWIFDYPAQVSLLGTQIWWTTEVNISFSRLEEGYENAIKDYYKKQINQLNTLIGLLIGNLTSNDRQNIMTICTIDVHAKDVVGKLIDQKIDSAQAFLWLSQLRLRWDDKLNHVFGNICDAQFMYSYEYLGCTPRLVITPLTDRCYITLTQSLHLTMSGAPAGPAGTGKTETTKDLGRALGIMVYVFNCSEQMDYKSIGNIYKGLAQTGAWGCFDEFNRISVEVLSVVAVQVKTIQDAIKEKRERFDFLGENIRLVPSVGLFITMNPGYAGRTELPENLKALFRPCAMVVPDFAMICEIMLVAEGFIDNRLLARKFITLYTLCRELLSKQDHYDWGLRAIKSVLVVAGALKRSDPGRAEDQVLMRALRDFNIPKIVTDDLPVFMGLIGDLFPALDVPRKRDPDFEKIVKVSHSSIFLQPEDNFLLKIVQLEELLGPNKSIFIQSLEWVLKSLHKTYQLMKRKPMWVDINPKAVTNNELYGVINPSTREWKDGLFSTIMRDLSNVTHDGPKWIVLDGDIDPMWIESLNTVMDDNKVLTLASNERIPLTPTMRMLFEISHLKAATPATVSRAGILFVNPADLGWNPPVSSWIDQREVQSERANLTILFDKYVPPILEALKTRFKTIIPIPEQSMIQMLCYMLEVLLTPENTPPDCPKDLYELYFVFACIWAFGGAMFQDQLVDHRVEFSKWWTTEFKTIKFPSHGTVFEYFIDNNTKKFTPWNEKVPHFELDPEMPLQAVLVHNSEICVKYFMDLLMAQYRPVMLVGNAGVGKSVLVNNKLGSLDQEDYVVTNVPFNYYTTSQMLQNVLCLEKPLEKKAGRNYGPPGTKRLIYFIDDINMPEVDKYGTVQPHTLIRQHMDYKHWYDRQKLSLKEIHNVQYVCCMNPTSGSFTISSRLQRHFCVFALSFPGKDAVKTIYNSIFSQHLKINKFSMAVQKQCGQLVDAALFLHTRITQVFLPTAIKFHYVFNLRDLSNIFQGMLFVTPDSVKTMTDVVKLWLHEASRVYRDKLVDDKDMHTYDELSMDISKKYFEDFAETAVRPDPHIYCHFATGIGDPKYYPIPSWESLNRLLVEALDNYNEMNAVMNLVLFGDAMAHVCRINRIFESPRGYALLVGVGGSGKQSLSRLAAFISNLDVFQITLRKGYGIADLKIDLGALFVKAGVKNVGVLFLLTDAQVSDERFLVLVNDMLSTGEISDLFPDDEIEGIINGVRNEVKGMGGWLIQGRLAWRFFIDRITVHVLHSIQQVALCFSPVGSTLRVRARKFPGVVNCTAIDWFHEWPQDALESVSLRFLSDIENVEETERESISKFLSFVHMSVNDLGKEYLLNDRRYNYTTPKSFLEQITLYETLLNKKSSELQASVERLENGLEKLRSTAAQVDDLKAKLAAQEIELKQKNEDADKLIQVVGVETEKVSKEKAVADVEEEKVTAIEVEVSKKRTDCERDLAKAEPALIAAQAALDTLNKNNLTELKSFGSPPADVVNVVSAVMVLMAPGGKVPKDRSWKAGKIMMAKVDQFLDGLINYDKENIHESCLKAIKPYLDMKEFDADYIRNKSLAAAGLCAWTINIVNFYVIFCDVEPKRIALAKANADLQAAQDKLAVIKNKIAVLNSNLAELTAQFEEATAAKLKCQQQAEATQLTISLANRLVGGLTSENVRWAQSVQNFREQESKLTGNVLLVTAFVSYVGYFTKSYRLRLMDELWLPFIKSLPVPIPITDGLDYISLLTDEADIAAWNNEGLPSDRMSNENATILTNCQRWPLMVDPQLQGIKWIKNKYGKDLKVIRIGQRGYLDTIENALGVGDPVLIENIEESVDPVLGPLLGRETIKKGRQVFIGDKECEYHRDFRLVLHTKLANPHYQPEMQAQCTLINFTVTRDGLEDQLLADVVGMERPDLEALKLDLTKQQNDFKITLKRLEDDLLARLSAASGNFLSDTALVENLENTKKTAGEVEHKVKEAQTTELQINEAREHYRPAAARASLLYFILNDLNKIHPMYQFSLKSFSIVFEKAVKKAEPDENLKNRVKNLITSISFSVFLYTTRGLFEKHKIIFTAQMAFQILLIQKLINPVELDFLLRFPSQMNVTSPVDFLSNHSWGAVKLLSEMEEFRNLDRDIEGSAKRWKKLVESEAPEKEKLPQEWKNKNALQKLCIMRALRADRMTYAVRDFVEERLGADYVDTRGIPFEKSYEETGPATPTFFILSPGVDPLQDVEKLGKKLGFTFDNKKFHNVSLGQGQEVVAESALDTAAEHGHWVVLQNIHLVAKWLMALQNRLEKHSVGSHTDFRVFMSAEPAATAGSHIIPQGILENAIKITNEPPTGMHSNLHKAFDNFNQETLEMCAREVEFKSILFSLCYFHAVVSERRKFGPQGWNRVYPYNTGDLTISVNVLYNYLEANQKVPWDDLRYLFGEIMYGGHITDDWDRHLCRTYLKEYMNQDMFDNVIYLAPGFPLPPSLDYNGYHQYIDDVLPPESPYLYGLHPNAEIDFLTTTSDNLFRTILELMPRDTSSGAGAGPTRDEKIKSVLDEILEKLPEQFNMLEMMSKVEPADRTPYVVVAFQECERMNGLTNEIRSSLKTLDLGLKGELTITASMEALGNAMFLDSVPDSWQAKAYPSMSGLTTWYVDLLLRIKELENWTSDFQLPAAVWLGGFFNPQSFLTAIMQAMARKNEWPLDKMCLQCDVTKKNKEDFSSSPREGAYIHSLFMEGARWDVQTSLISEGILKDLTPTLPVIFIKAIPVDKQETRNIYPCPVYKTKMRGPTFVWTFNLKTKEKPAKWTLGGVAILLMV
uniref:AAA+ ATPase domain-containing protein n=1 Tax=Ciona savignyi TaxID=51511 RepID=H2YYB5_CIOSA